jgi:hypothetical protein
VLEETSLAIWTVEPLMELLASLRLVFVVGWVLVYYFDVTMSKLAFVAISACS